MAHPWVDGGLLGLECLPRIAHVLLPRTQGVEYRLCVCAYVLLPLYVCVPVCVPVLMCLMPVGL
jgi:hypothetical protein